MKKSVELGYKKLAAAVAFAAVASTGTGSLMAQEVEEIQVTGSFISRPADRPQPVAVMDNQELQANQRVTIAEAVRDMPQISTANTVGNWNTPSNSINLRGLGTRSTLILLNGQRQTIDGNNGSQVDINNLAPAIMLERIELVLDGASALYGSDAVAGVANFITRNNFEGAEIQVSSQHSAYQSSVPETVVSAIFGVQGDDLGLVMALEWFNRSDQLLSEDRFSDERLGEGLITGLYNPGTFFGGDGVGGIHADPLCGDPLIGGLPGNVIWDPAGATLHNGDGLFDGRNSFCRGTLSLQRTIIPQNEQMTGMAVATKQFDGDFLQQMTVEMNFARVETKSSFGTGVPLLALGEVSAYMPPNNPGVIDANARSGGAFPIQGYRNIFTRQASPLEGELESFARQNTFRATLGLEGMLTDVWDWRLTGTMSFQEQTSQQADTITDRYARALQGYGGPGCKGSFVNGLANDPDLQQGVGGCEWWNPFASRLIAQPGDPTYNSKELQEWMTWGRLDRGIAKFYSLEFVTTGELWEMAGGATGVALGAQYRRQTLDFINDPIALDGGFGFNPQVVNDWSSNRDTDALFAEMVMFPTDTLEFSLAARYEDTLGQSSVEPKASMLWTPADNLFVRASAGSSFRLGSEFQSNGIGASGTTIRPIGGEVTQARAIARGNPNLLPEESDNWTIGFTWDINDAWTVEVNYWDYEFSNLITTISPDDILLEDIADGFVDDPRNQVFPGRPREVCEVTGRWDGVDVATRPADCITGLDFQLFNSSYVNRDTVETSGVDYSIDYSFDAFGGEAGIRLTGVNVRRYAGTTNAGDLIDVVGTDGGGVSGVGTNPENRANIVATFARGNHSGRWTTRFTDGTELRNPGSFQYNTIEGSASFHDFLYTYTMPGNGDASVTVAILNVGDKEPPLVANTLTTTNSGLYDPRGRMYRVGYNMSF